MPQIQEETCGDLLENAPGSAMMSTPVPFFEFSVVSEEGINLFVDISSSSMEWSKRLKNGVCLCQALKENKFQSFRQELEYLQKNYKPIKSSFTWNTNSRSRLESDDATIGLSPVAFNRENDHMEVNPPDLENGSLEISENKQCKIVHKVSEYVEQQEEKTTFCGHDSDLKDLVVSNTISIPSLEKIEPMLGEEFYASQAKPTCILAEMLAANEPEATWDRQNTELWNKTCMNAGIKNEKSEPKIGVPFSVTPAISTPEMQSSEVAGLCKDVAFSPFISDPMLNLFNTAETTKMGDEELANSIEIDQNGDFKSSSVEEQAGDYGVIRAEALCISGKKAEIPSGLKRKRHCNQANKNYGLYSGRILRSAKRHCREGLMRRSKRLFSK